MFKKISVVTFLTASFLFPVLAVAQTSSSRNKTITTVVGTLTGLINIFLFLLMGVAILVFVYHIFKYYILPNSDRSEAGKYVMWSLIGFFVILSFWGLVNILQNTFGLKNENNRPSTWASFTDLFPSSNTSSSNNSGYTDFSNSNNSGYTDFTNSNSSGYSDFSNH